MLKHIKVSKTMFYCNQLKILTKILIVSTLIFLISIKQQQNFSSHNTLPLKEESLNAMKTFLSIKLLYKCTTYTYPIYIMACLFYSMLPFLKEILISPYKLNSTLDKASAITLSFPLMCLMSRLYSCKVKLHLTNRWFLFFIRWMNVSGL